MPGAMFTLVSRLGASSSSCSRNRRAIARARPTQRPTCWASFGNFWGPSTISAIAKISRSSEKPTSNMKKLRRPAVSVYARGSTPRTSGLVLALFRLRLGGIGKLGVGLELFDGLLGIPFVHRLLEAAHGGTEVGSDRLELLGPEHEQYDDQNDNEFFETNRAH